MQFQQDMGSDDDDDDDDDDGDGVCSKTCDLMKDFCSGKMLLKTLRW